MTLFIMTSKLLIDDGLFALTTCYVRRKSVYVCSVTQLLTISQQVQDVIILFVFTHSCSCRAYVPQHNLSQLVHLFQMAYCILVLNAKWLLKSKLIKVNKQGVHLH